MREREREKKMKHVIGWMVGDELND